jgi:hypothetical protein
MKKMFLKLLLLLALILAPQISSTNNYESENYQKIENNNNIIVQNWTLIGDNCWGCAGVFYRIDMSRTRNSYGFYEFYIYLYSNSWWPNEIPANTMCNNIKIFKNNILMDKFWSVIEHKPTHIYTVYGESSYTQLWITIDKLNLN